MKKFLDNFPDTVFQVFKDSPQSKVYAQTFLQYEQESFKKLNRQGGGIYFTPNSFGKKRQKAHILSLNAVYADIDVRKEGGGKDALDAKYELLRALCQDRITPNFIIDTKNGFQPLWLIEEADREPTEENIELYQNVVKGIIEWSKKFGGMGDKVYDITRVLRLPNYCHMKNPKEPYTCKAWKFSEDMWPLSYMAEAFPYEEVVNKKIVQPLETTPTMMALDTIPFQDLIIRAFREVGRQAEFDDQKRLILDGRLTGTHQGKVNDGDFLASNSHEPFVGNRITATAEILACTTKEAFKWIKETFNISEAKIKAKEAVNTLKKKVERKEVDKYYSWGTPVLTESFAPIKRNTYTIVGAAAGTGKTTFCMNMALANAELGHKVLYLSLEMDQEEIFDYLSRKHAGITISEEIYKNIPETKKASYDEQKNYLFNLENLTIKGIRGGAEITWEVITEFVTEQYDLIFIDNLNCIIPSEKENRYEHEGWLSTQFMNFAEARQTPLVIVHHYSKGGQQADKKSRYSLSGNAKIINDSHRIVLLDRRRFEQDETPTAKQKAALSVLLDKGRGYDDNVRKVIYFHKGRFFDEMPGQELQPTDSQWWEK